MRRQAFRFRTFWILCSSRQYPSWPGVVLPDGFQSSTGAAEVDSTGTVDSRDFWYSARVPAHFGLRPGSRQASAVSLNHPA